MKNILLIFCCLFFFNITEGKIDIAINSTNYFINGKEYKYNEMLLLKDFEKLILSKHNKSKKDIGWTEIYYYKKYRIICQTLKIDYIERLSSITIYFDPINESKFKISKPSLCDLSILGKKINANTTQEEIANDTVIKSYIDDTNKELTNIVHLALINFNLYIQYNAEGKIRYISLNFI
jgi:hypothetical protein